jgi:transposase-like protein
MSQNGKRKQWRSADKLRIVLAGLDGTIGISDLCRREGVNPTQYYAWKNQLLKSASKVFDGSESHRSGAREQRMEAELVRAKNVIAEITAENLELKKGL